MREILEWHAALKNAIEQGYPLSDTWFGNYRRQVQSNLALTRAVEWTAKRPRKQAKRAG
jgi:hypothetical protein